VKATPITRRVLAVLVSTVFGALPFAAAQNPTLITNPGFGPVGGAISGMLDINIFDPAPSSVTQQLGSSGWYGRANVTAVGNIGFRPGIEVDASAASAGVGYISYALGASLGGLAGLEMPDAYLWQPLTGTSLAAHTTYTFSIEVNAGALLDVSALGSRGFGLGVSVGASASSTGTMFADSLSSPSLLSLSLLGGTTQQMTLSFTTGANPAAGDVGVAVFAGRGVQALQLSLLNEYKVDNASFSSASAVPEPSSSVMVLSGIGMFILARRRTPLRLH
jgi:hypothetical protein